MRHRDEQPPTPMDELISSSFEFFFLGVDSRRAGEGGGEDDVVLLHVLLIQIFQSHFLLIDAVTSSAIINIFPLNFIFFFVVGVHCVCNANSRNLENDAPLVSLLQPSDWCRLDCKQLKRQVKQAVSCGR